MGSFPYGFVLSDVSELPVKNLPKMDQYCTWYFQMKPHPPFKQMHYNILYITPQAVSCSVQAAY